MAAFASFILSIHWINHYPADSVVCFANTLYSLASDVAAGWRYPAFEQPRSDQRECSLVVYPEL